RAGAGPDRRGRAADASGIVRRGRHAPGRHAGGSRRDRRRPRPARRRRRDVAGLLQLRHVPQLRAPRRGISRGGAQGDHPMSNHVERAPGPSATPAAAVTYPFDPVLFAAVVALIVLGVVMAYSASAVYAAQKYHDPAYFLEREAVYALLGALAMWYGAKTDFHVWRRWAYPMVIGAILLLVGVLFLGARINGAMRWYRFGPLSFQPAEL